MDPLSDVLSALELRSTFSSRFEGRGSWAFRFPAYRSHIKFGGVLEGSFQLRVEALQVPVQLRAGDFYLLLNGRPFSSSSDATTSAVDGSRAYREHRDAHGVVRVGNEGPLVSLASGRFGFEGDVGDLLLRHLPPLIHLRAEDPQARPMQGLLELLRWETADDAENRPGASVARASLASMLLVQALRIHLAGTPQPEGWLGAMTDPRIGRAMSAVHGDLTQRWTVAQLADRAGMSRTAFASRFRERVGETPLDYLTHWRMRVARKALRGGDEAIARIAERVGYLSDTAFSAAFRRATGQSPGRYRAAGRGTPEDRSAH